MSFISGQTDQANCVDKLQIKSRYQIFFLALSSILNALSESLYEEPKKYGYLCSTHFIMAKRENFR